MTTIIVYGDHALPFLPLKVEHSSVSGGGDWLINSNDEIVMTVPPGCANFIASAINHHDALVAMLGKLIVLVNEFAPDAYQDVVDIKSSASDLLAKVKA
jgi:hypothetical protein